MADVFVSHVQEDSSDALLISQLLENEGYQVWYYERDSLPGKTYIEQIVGALEQIKAVVLLISPSTLRSSQVDREVVNAFLRNKPIFPILTGLSCEEFNQRKPDWDHILGATT